MARKTLRQRLIQASDDLAEQTEHGEFVEEIELTEQDEEILDDVWSRLREKWREEDIEAGIRLPD